MRTLRIIVTGLAALAAAAGSAAAQERCPTEGLEAEYRQPPTPGQPLRLTTDSGITRPKLTRSSPPQYPRDALQKRIQGCVYMEAVVGADGKTTDVRVLKSIPQLDDAAVAAVKGWEFTPATLNGKPVAVFIIASVGFFNKLPPPMALAPRGYSPGKRELEANPVTPDNPIPRRAVSRMPDYPDGARKLDAEATVVLWMTVDRSGRVSEVRTAAPPTGTAASGSIDAATRAAAGDAFIQAATSAAKQWRYDKPARGPLSFGVAFTFKPGADTFVEDVVPPVKVKHVEPDRRPKTSAYGNVRRLTMSGTVALVALVGADGRVADVRTARSTPILDDLAAAAVRQWEYTPALRGGSPTAVWVPVVMNLSIVFED
jgi:protein TonB